MLFQKLRILFGFGISLLWVLLNFAENRPNVVIFLSDDQGWGDFSYTGNADISTPNIDSLAQQGAFFEHFYVQPVCSPTRAEFLTGRYHVRSGVYSTSAGGERLNLDETTIADVFRSAGYRTAAFGKWHNGSQYPYHPNGRGFEEYYGFTSGHWGNYYDAELLDHNGETVQGEGFLVDEFTDRAMDFIEQHKDEPFFVYLPYPTPHSPMQVPDRWWNKFKNKELTLPGNPSQKEIDHARAALAMCENIDWNVGRLLKHLNDLNLSENTIILYFNDNGPNGERWKDGLRGRKGSTDEGGVRTPLFMRWPAMIKSGQTISQITSAIDLLPTLAEMAGIPANTNNELDGVSLKPLINDPKPEWKDRYIINYWSNRLSVRSQQYRLDHMNQLYDVEVDPEQSTDIRELKPEVFKELLAVKKEWAESTLANTHLSFEADERPNPVGHPDFVNTLLPARDADYHGNIRRSNRWPNCSFLTSWLVSGDYISWDINVQTAGKYRVTVHYTAPEWVVDTRLELSFKNHSTSAQITESFDPPLRGMDEDRVIRTESYVKQFKPLYMGVIRLEAGAGTLELRAPFIPGNRGPDIRLVELRRLD